MLPADDSTPSLLVFADWLIDEGNETEADAVRLSTDNNTVNGWYYEYSVGGVAVGAVGVGGVGGGAGAGVGSGIGGAGIGGAGAGGGVGGGSVGGVAVGAVGGVVGD